MYKGYKVTKHLQRYMRYAKDKYERLNMQGENVELWEIIEGYKIFKNQAECVQMYIYDWINGKTYDEAKYKIINGRDGCIYVKKVYVINSIMEKEQPV